MGGENTDMKGYCDLTTENYGTEAGLFTIASSVFFLLCIVVIAGAVPMKKLQDAPLGRRLEYVGVMNIYVSVVSFFFNVGHVLGYLVHVDHDAMTKLVFAEYMLTCPVMQASLALIGGPAVKEKHRSEVASLTLLVLTFGFAASLIESIILKMACFFLRASGFMVLVKINNSLVLEHSGGRESLFGGTY